MSKVIAILTTVPGQGSTSLAASIAWTLAQEHTTLAIDLDMSGMGNLADFINLDRRNKSVFPFLGYRTPVPASVIEEQAVESNKRRKLRIVPGLPGGCGPSVAKLLPNLKDAFKALPDEYVVLDLGAPLAHPEQGMQVDRVAEIISDTATRTFVVVQDTPTRMVASIYLLKAARFPQAELMFSDTRNGKQLKVLDQQMKQNLGDMKLGAVIPWNQSAARDAEDSAEPQPVKKLIEFLQL